MSILIEKNVKVLVQGLTGKEGRFHTQQMINYGTNIVGGITPGKGGNIFLDVPIFNTVEDAKKNTNATISVIFVPSSFAFDAILESIYTNIDLIVCITEGIPVSDMIKIKYFINKKKSFLIGPNCPGIISPEKSKVGIMPNSIFKKSGNVGIVSRSGTLTYEVAHQIIQMGYGISTAVGIGGDSIIGMNIIEIIDLFFKDSETKCIVLIGEIGGTLEIDAVEWIIKNKKNNKPIIGFIAGQTAPKGKTMGHAGAIIGKKIETAQEKMKVMKENGIKVVQSLEEIGKMVHQTLNNKK